MVLSLIDSSISYPELKSISSEDADKEAELYEMELLGVPVIIALGNIKKTYESKNVDYFPLYLVKSNSKVVQIGVYEVKASDLLNYMDDEDQLNLEKMNKPLLYVFCTKKMLTDLRMVPEKDETEVEEKKEKEEKVNVDEDGADNESVASTDEDKKLKRVVPEEVSAIRKDTFVLTTGVQIPAPLKEETKKDADRYREKYQESKDNTWVEGYMKNNKYYIIDNEGGGDCLFATIRDAFGQIAHQTTIQKLRSKLSKEITEDVFLNYKEQFDMYKLAIIQDTQQIKQLDSEYKKYKTKYSETLDRNEKRSYIENSKKIKEQHDNIVREKKVTNEMLKEFVFMKDVTTLEKFKEKIKTCEFWADTWAISTLERVLNIKFVLLSSLAYKEKDNANVIQCGQINDVILESRGEFTPDYYIVLDYTGDHYKLVGYKKKQIFKFKELPFDLKVKITDKCLEKNAGLFALIPDFQTFKKNLGLVETVQKFDELTEAKLKNLYDDNVVFMFYQNSSDKKMPGKGMGETIPKEFVRDYSGLASIKNWRNKLDDTWVQPFLIDGKRWNSVEHYYHGSKFKQGHPEFYLSFSAESGTDISKDPELAKAAASKTGKHKGKLLRPTEVGIDADFYKKRNEQELMNAQLAKFSQNEDLKQLLLATKNAKLVHYKRGKEPEFIESLVHIREKLSKQ